MDWAAFFMGVGVTFGALGFLLLVWGYRSALLHERAERESGICRACGGSRAEPRRGCRALFHTEAG